MLNKITRPFLIYVLIVLVISIPVYYVAVDAIWKHELDEHNQLIARRTEIRLNQMKLQEAQLTESIALWNKVQPGTTIEAVKPGVPLKDSSFTVVRKLPYSSEPDNDRFRGLSTVIYLNHLPYRFTVETNIEETRETIAVIAFITVGFVIIIMTGLLLLNRRLSLIVWKPFHSSLEKLKTFNLNSQTPVAFEENGIAEFEELNRSLHTLITHTIAAFKIQKEFTENASHELQTPLAVLKNKLDILLQDRDLTEKQYHIVEQMNNALGRSSRINKNLLLLAKIGNSQFDNSELIRFDLLLQHSMEVLEEHFEQKNISVTVGTLPQVEVRGNSSLTETLINNLLLNAIRHTAPGGTIRVGLEQKGFTMKNSGTGPLDTGQMFKRFSKLSTDSNGSGLGLAIVNEICLFHNWQIHYRFEHMQHVFNIIF
nr:HAMP domain-containing sensor histidine kinase [Niabella beijingensis]